MKYHCLVLQFPWFVVLLQYSLLRLSMKSRPVDLSSAPTPMMSLFCFLLCSTKSWNIQNLDHFTSFWNSQLMSTRIQKKTCWAPLGRCRCPLPLRTSVACKIWSFTHKRYLVKSQSYWVKFTLSISESINLTTLIPIPSDNPSLFLAHPVWCYLSSDGATKAWSNREETWLAPQLRSVSTKYKTQNHKCHKVMQQMQAPTAAQCRDKVLPTGVFQNVGILSFGRFQGFQCPCQLVQSWHGIRSFNKTYRLGLGPSIELLTRWCCEHHSQLVHGRLSPWNTR